MVGSGLQAVKLERPEQRVSVGFQARIHLTGGPGTGKMPALW